MFYENWCPPVNMATFLEIKSSMKTRMYHTDLMHVIDINWNTS
jgi:hypothetical protein